MSRLRRGPWSPEEDKHLLDLVSLFGGEKNLNWVKISQMLETRTAKQARERYHQNLKPSLNRTPITYEEGLLIEELVEKYGKRWAEIARHLNGRSDNAIKNWWNGGASRRKRLIDKKNGITNNTEEEEEEDDDDENENDGDRDDDEDQNVNLEDDDKDAVTSKVKEENNKFNNNESKLVSNTVPIAENSTSIDNHNNENSSNTDSENKHLVKQQHIFSSTNNPMNPPSGKPRSASVDIRLPPLTGTGNANSSSMNNNNYSMSQNSSSNSNNNSIDSNEIARKRKIKEDPISKRRHSAASIGSNTSNFSLPHPMTSPYLGATLTSLTALHNSSNLNNNHLMSPPSSNIESMTSSPRGDSRSSRASSIGSNDLLANSLSGDRDSSTSRRGSIWGTPSIGTGSSLRRGSLNSFNISRRESLGGRLSVTSLNQYSISQQGQVIQSNNNKSVTFNPPCLGNSNNNNSTATILSSNNNNNNNNNNTNNNTTTTTNTNNSKNINNYNKNSLDDNNVLKKDIFKKGFNLSNFNSNANIPKAKSNEGPRGELKDSELHEDTNNLDKTDEKTSQNKPSNDEQTREGGGKIKMSISSLVS
ncbi:hypothetical protein C6P42_002303 [Pichia californica]|nr:hypothetical protein C6P42_002303 [[Candida] californica]